MSGKAQPSSETLSARIQEHLRSSGYSQKELAEAIGLHHKVLSRKLHGSASAHLTSTEVKRIIVTLVDWHAIGSQDEVLSMSGMTQVGPNLFSAEEWQSAPLSTLTKNKVPPSPLTSSPPPFSIRQHNLPATATKLIGREWAVKRLQGQLDREDVRLVTLVGSGGSGKTRLALHVASAMTTFAHGARFVPLARVHDPNQVPMSIIQALQITAALNLTPMQSVLAYLNNKQLLLVLDNLEQIEDAAAVVNDLLAASPHLKILATSRVLLRLYGEHAFNVPPLDLPGSNNDLDSAVLSQYGAIQLFVERAQATAPDFVLNDENATTIAQICARVDGLPLALELAAARIKMLTPALLLERLSQDRLNVLTGGARNLPGRQQTLRNTIAWSYDLLNPVETMWFCRLSVFTGSWSLEAAETMMQDLALNQYAAPINDASLDMLERLVDSSLIVIAPAVGSQTRFTMLETLREYALEGLQNQGEGAQLRDWHACYFLHVAEMAEKGLRGPAQSTWLARLAADHDNVWAALQWSLQKARQGETIRTFSFPLQSSKERETVAGSRILSQRAFPMDSMSAVELCLRLTAAFRPYLEWRGYLPEARSWLKSALALPFKASDGATVLAARGKALSELARLTCLEHDQECSAALAEESIALWRQLNDASGLASALMHRSWSAHATADYELAKRVCWEGLSYLDPSADLWLRAQLFVYLGAASGFTYDYEQMRSFYAQSIELFEQLGDKSAVADVLKDHGGMLILQGEYSKAIDNLLKSVRLSYELDHKQYISSGLGLLSFAVGMREETDAVQACLLSAQLEGLAHAMMEAIGFSPWTQSYPMAHIVRQHIRSRVDEQRYAEAYALGRTLTIEQALALIP